MLRITAAFVLLVIESWALVQVLGSPVATGRKVRWMAAIVLLPVVGVVLWLRKGPRPSERARHGI